MKEHGPLASAALRRASTCSSRSRWRPPWKRPPRCCSSPPMRPGISVRPAHPALAHLSRGHATRRGRRHRPAAAGTGALRLVGPGLGPLVLRARRRGSLRPRRLQRHCAVRPLRAGARVTAMAGVAIPERVVEGETMRVQAEDNAHVLIDFGDARFASVTTGFTMQRYRSPAIELYGSEGVLQLLGDDWAPRLRAVAQLRGRVGVVPRERPGLAVDRGPAAPRRLHRDGPRARDAARARLSRTRDHARREGGCCRRSREGDRQRLPAAELATLEHPSDGRRVHDPRSALIQERV